MSRCFAMLALADSLTIRRLHDLLIFDGCIAPALPIDFTHKGMTVRGRSGATRRFLPPLLLYENIQIGAYSQTVWLSIIEGLA